MPIVPAFDPSTGASGGPQGGGGAPTGWVAIGDLTPLTFSDPAGVLTSYAFNAGDHEFDMTTQLANADFALNSGANFTGPRWSAPLVDGAGQPVLAGDRFMMMVELTDLDAGLSRQWAAAWGVAKIPTSTTTATIAPRCISGGATAVGTPNAGAFNLNLGSTSSLVGGVTVSGTQLFLGAPGRLPVGGSVGLQSASAAAATQRLDGVSGWAGADADPLQFFVCVTSLGAVATTAGLLKMKARYQIVRF
jgi:hypothetical protein